MPSYIGKASANAAATRVKGVAEEIEVKPFGDTLWADEEIAERAAQLLTFDGAVPKNKVKLTVDKGWIILTAYIDWNYQKTSADHAIHRLIGVLGVTNDIKIQTLRLMRCAKRSKGRSTASLPSKRRIFRSAPTAAR